MKKLLLYNKKIQHVILISRAICVVFTPVTFAFTTAGNHMVSNSILSECWENNHTSTVGSDRLLLSSDQDIGTFVAAFLCVCVCARVWARACVQTRVVCVCPPCCDQIHHFGHEPCPPLHISGQHLQGGKKIINDLISEIRGKGRIWVTPSFFLFFSCLRCEKSWWYPNRHARMH